MPRFRAILFTAALLVGISLVAGATPSYAASVLTPTTPADGPTINIVTGSDRYETAVRVSQAGFPQGAPAVVIARGDDFPDALCGAPLARAYGGPLLLTPLGGLTPVAMTELRRLQPSRVFLVGIGYGSTTIRSQVSSVIGPGRTTILEGRDRYATAALVAEQIKAKLGARATAVVVRGDRFPDTLAVGPLASARGWPILLASGEQDLPQVTRDELTRLGVTSVLEAGTRARVDVPNVVRKVGIDRYETCAMIAEYALTQGLESTHTALATGEDFPDGIASAPYLALDNGTLLLTKGLTLTAPVEQFLGSNAGDIRTVDAIGIAGIAAQARVVLSRKNDSPPPSPTSTIPPIGATTTTVRPTTTSTSLSAPTTIAPVTTTTTAPPAVTTTTLRSPSTTTTSALTTGTTAAPPATTTTTLRLISATLAGVLNVRDFGAKGDGTTDDIDAIQACITSAAAADKEVYFPAGTYKVSGGIWLPTGDSAYSGLVIRGAGAGQTIITMNAQPSTAYMFYAVDLSNVHLSDMTFRTPTSYSNNIRAIFSTGMQNSSIRRIKIENCDYGIKLGSGNQSNGWVIEDIVTRNIGILSLQPIDVSNSTFRNLDLQNRMDTGTGMCVYIERDNHNLTFENLRCVGGSRNCIQLYNGYGTPTSDHISFRDTYLDNRGGPKYPLTIDPAFSDVSFVNTTIYANDNENPCIVWYGGTRVVFDGITASGGAALHQLWGDTPANCAIRNGTYQGSAIGSVAGVIVSNVMLGGTSR